MTELVTTCAEREPLGKDRYRSTLHIKPVAFRDGSRLKRIKPDWIGSGLSARPHLIDEAPMIVSANNRGLRRVYPTRDMNVWVEIGAPRIQSGTRLQNMIRGNVKRKGIGLSWADSRMNTITQMGGHFLEMKTELLKGWTPPGGKIAYEFKTRGLTRKGDVLFADGKPVMHLQQPVMTDLANDEGDTRPIKYEYVELGGKLHLVYVLPDLTGMKRPCVDPTLELQPDAAAGKDAFINGAAGSLDKNYGVTVYVSGDSNKHALIQFDVSSIPATATIDSSIPSFRTTTYTSADTISLHRTLVAWFEGTKNGVAPGAADGSTWNHRNANSGGQVAWTGGAGGASGTEYAAAVNTTGTPTAANTFENYTDAKVDVQAWVDGTYTNYGWWSTQDGSDNYGFLSSDTATATNRPKLVTVYTLAGGDAPFGRIFAPGFRGAFG